MKENLAANDFRRATKRLKRRKPKEKPYFIEFDEVVESGDPVPAKYKNRWGKPFSS